MTVWPVYVDMCCRTGRDFACLFVKGDGLQLGFFVDVCGLEDMVRPVKDDERVAGDVRLELQFELAAAGEKNGRGSRSIQ